MKKLKAKRKGNKFEDKCQKSLSSGRLWFSPLDLDYENYCVEVKYTDKKGFRVSADLVEKIWDSALSMNKEPLLVIGIRRNEEQIFTLQCQVKLDSAL